MKEHFSSRVTKLLVILALAIVASVMFVIVGCSEPEETHTVHTWVADTSREDVDATCTTTGVHYVICSECGMTSTEETPALGHEWANDGNMLRQEPTCTEDGYYYRECTREGCGYRETSTIIAKTGHKLNFADVTITAPTCTADGSISGACAACGETIAISADDIKKDVNLIGYTDDAAQDKQDAANEDAEEGEEVDYNIGEKDGKSTFLQKLGHDYAIAEDSNAFRVCVANFNDKYFDKDSTGTKEYWNYCVRCGEKFEVEDHTMPKGAVPCKQGERLADGYAYVCTVCQKPVPIDEHTYVLSERVQENGKYVFKAAPEGATLSCRYYLVCEYCDHYEVAKPHASVSEITDAKFLATCQHGAICPNCYDAETGYAYYLTQPLAHDKLGTDGVFDDHNGNVKATCTTKGFTAHWYCTMCKAAEAAGADITWTDGVNCDYTEVDPTGHTWFRQIDAAEEGQSMCLVGKVNIDVCTACGATRQSERPTFYKDYNTTTKQLSNEIKTESAFNTAEHAYYTAANGNVLDAKAATATVDWNSYTVNYDKYDATSEENNLIPGESLTYAFKWTDERGAYNKQDPAEGGHDKVMLLVDYSNKDLYPYGKEPTCTVKGKVLFKCTVCGDQMWEDVTLQEYAHYYYTALSLDQKNTEVSVDLDGNSVVEKYATEAAFVSAMTNMQKYHTGTMYACGHGYCDAQSCGYGHHTTQFTVTVNYTLAEGTPASITTPAPETFIGYGCLSYDENQERLDDFVETLAEENFTLKFTTYSNDARPTPVVNADIENVEAFWDSIGMASNTGEPFVLNVTVNAVLTPDKAYTVSFDTSVLKEQNAVIASNAAFAQRTVYKAELVDGFEIAAPVVGDYIFKFTVDGEEFDFADFDWTKLTSDITIAVELA